MKFIYPIICCLHLVVYGQANPDVFIMDVTMNAETLSISNFKNISSNPGYDNQPSFATNNKLLYAGTQNGQTEIMTYLIDSDATYTLNAFTAGSEFSPQQFPTKNEIAAVRLDTTGLQRLYTYNSDNPGNGQHKMLLPGIEVAYFAFQDNERIIASILSGNALDLIMGNLMTGESTLLFENTGRSIHKVPKSNSISFTAVNDEGNMDVYLIDIDGDMQPYFVCQLPIGIQDYCWLSDTQLLLGSNDTLYMYDLFKNMKWEKAVDLSAYNIKNITRITASPDGKKIALVAEN